MTKMSGVNLPDMIDQQNLIVDDIFNENFNAKRKKVQLDAYSDVKKTIDSESNFADNNNVKLIDKQIDLPQNLKRKIKNVAVDDNYINTELNISIDKDSNRTIRLELRHPANDTNGHRTEQGTEVSLDSGSMDEYNLKDGVDLNMEEHDKNGEIVRHNGDYRDGNDSQGDDVS